jgi:glycosyltransferase involved in cell wall biosynthesis
MRRVGWELGEKKPAAAFNAAENHVALNFVAPRHGFAHWRILPEWIERTAREKGEAWRDCRMVLRLYDVSLIIFNGFNAHRIIDIALPQISGHLFFHLPKPGATQLAEVGFVLRKGEFIPASRSLAVHFPPEAASGHSSTAALLVDEKLHCEPVQNLWDGEQFLIERKKPTLRKPLRIATLAFDAAALGQSGPLATFATELAKHQRADGHEVHVFAPRRENFDVTREIDGVVHHPLDLDLNLPPVHLALNFAHAAEQKISTLPGFDLFHVHEWIAGMAPWLNTRPAVLSLSSIETTRRNGADATPLSLEIQKTEREIARGFECVLTPDWLHAKALAEFGVDEQKLLAFPMEGRLPNEWEAPLDVGRVKQELGFGPFDRMLLFVGPLEHGAGPDLLVESLPVALQRAPNLRIAFIGSGSLHDLIYRRAGELGAGHAVRVHGGHGGIGQSLFRRALRACQAVVLPARHRVDGDDAIVGWARLAGRAVVTTHGGPAYLVKHEDNGIVTYDNPGSMVWALDRILGDANNTERMGANGRQQAQQGQINPWSDVTQRYFEVCVDAFPELTS